MQKADMKKPSIRGRFINLQTQKNRWQAVHLQTTEAV